MPIRLCIEPGCPFPAAYRGRCRAHNVNFKAARRDNHRVYNTKRWRLLRRHVLTLHPMCQRCDQALATQADHIVPLTAGGAPYDPLNIQALCHPCHSIKTKQERA